MLNPSVGSELNFIAEQILDDFVEVLRALQPSKFHYSIKYEFSTLLLDDSVAVKLNLVTFFPPSLQGMADKTDEIKRNFSILHKQKRALGVTLCKSFALLI